MIFAYCQEQPEKVRVIVVGPQNTSIDYSEYTHSVNDTEAYNMPGNMDYLGYNGLFEPKNARKFFDIWNGTFELVLQPSTKYFRINAMTPFESGKGMRLYIFKGNKTIVNETIAPESNVGSLSYATIDRYYDANGTLMQSFAAGKRNM